MYEFSPFRKLLLDLSHKLTTEDGSVLLFLAELGDGVMEKCQSTVSVLQQLERSGKISSTNLKFLKDSFESMKRCDLIGPVGKFRHMIFF